jgi:hypothetical protein
VERLPAPLASGQLLAWRDRELQDAQHLEEMPKSPDREVQRRGEASAISDRNRSLR